MPATAERAESPAGFEHSQPSQGPRRRHSVHAGATGSTQRRQGAGRGLDGDADGETARIYDILMEGGEHHHMLGDVYPETGDLEGDGYGDAIDGFDSEAMDVLKEMILGNLNTQPGPLPPPAR